MKTVVAILGVSLLIAACSDDSAVPVRQNTPRDYTVVSKFREGEPRPFYYVTVLFNGVERKLNISEHCYERASLGSVLPASVSYNGPTYRDGVWGTGTIVDNCR